MDEKQLAGIEERLNNSDTSYTDNLGRFLDIWYFQYGSGMELKVTDVRDLIAEVRRLRGGSNEILTLKSADVTHAPGEPMFTWTKRGE